MKNTGLSLKEEGRPIQLGPWPYLPPEYSRALIKMIHRDLCPSEKGLVIAEVIEEEEKVRHHAAKLADLRCRLKKIIRNEAKRRPLK
jgi:hypothetical protein